MKTSIKNTLIAGSSFAGGILTGLLLTAKPGRTDIQTIREMLSKNAGRWLDSGEENLHKITQIFKERVSNPLPDLYSATESFCLDEEDLMDV